jgi:PAS domain S-box-containing protein
MSLSHDSVVNLKKVSNKLSDSALDGAIDRVRALERELQHTKMQLKSAQKACYFGTFEWDLFADKIRWSPEAELLLGASVGSLNENLFGWMEIVHPEDVERLMFEIRNSVAKRKDLVSEFRVVHTDKSTHWITLKGEVIWDGKTSPVRLLGVVYEITSRKQTEEGLLFLSEASQILSSSLNFKTTLSQVANLAVPRIADWCVVDMVKETGGFEEVAIAHVDQRKVKWAKKYREEFPVNPNAVSGVANVVASGKSEFYPIITDEILVKGALNKRHLKLMRKIGFGSVIVVPLFRENKTVGAISLVMDSSSGRRFNETDLHLAQQLSSRASLAIENSRLYGEVELGRKRVNTIISELPGVVWEAWGNPSGPNQRIDFVNDRVESMLGYSVSQWLSVPNFWLTIVHPEDRQRAAAEAAEIFHGGIGGTSRFRWITKDGRIIWVEAQSSVITDNQGKPVGMRGVTLDISERIELEKRKDEFMSMASHELKTPVTSLKVYVDLFKKQLQVGNTSQLESYLEKIDKQIFKLTKLIRDLLDISKVEAGKLISELSKFDLGELALEMVDVSAQLSDQHEILCICQLDEAIFGDQERIGQVVLNLINNAIKYSPLGGKIIVKVYKEGANAILSVQDFGVGIDAVHHTKIFDRYYQVTDPFERTYPGLGIGLYVSNEIAKRHGGQMWVESEKGEGSIFYLALPLST